MQATAVAVAAKKLFHQVTVMCDVGYAKRNSDDGGGADIGESDDMVHMIILSN